MRTDLRRRKSQYNKIFSKFHCPGVAKNQGGAPAAGRIIPRGGNTYSTLHLEMILAQDNVETYNVFLPKAPFIMILYLCLIFDFWPVLCADICLWTVRIFACGLCGYFACGLCAFLARYSLRSSRALRARRARFASPWRHKHVIGFHVLPRSKGNPCCSRVPSPKEPVLLRLGVLSFLTWFLKNLLRSH